MSFNWRHFWCGEFSGTVLVQRLDHSQRDCRTNLGKPPIASGRRLPAEHFGSAIRTGLRHAASNPHLRATLRRAAGFFYFREHLLGICFRLSRQNRSQRQTRSFTAFSWVGL